MSTVNRLNPVLLALCGALVIAPVFVAAQDADTKSVQSYALTDSGLAKYTQATKSLAALPGNPTSCGDDDSESDSQSLSNIAARIDAVPGAKNAIQSAGLSTREYVVFMFSLLHNGMAAWAVSQPGGKLPPGVSKANVDFYNKHKAELDELKELSGDDQCEESGEDTGN